MNQIIKSLKFIVNSLFSFILLQNILANPITEINGTVLFNGEEIRGVLFVNDSGYIDTSNTEGEYSIDFQKTYLVFKEGYITRFFHTGYNEINLKKLRSDTIETVINSKRIVTRIPKRDVTILFPKTQNSERFEPNVFVEGYDSSFKFVLSDSLRRNDFFENKIEIRNDVLSDVRNEVWIIDPHLIPIQKQISRSNLVIKVETGDIKPKKLGLFLKVIDIKGIVHGFIKSKQILNREGLISLNKSGYTKIVIDSPYNDEFSCEFLDESRKYNELFKVITSPDSLSQHVTLKLSVDLTKKLDEIKKLEEEKRRAEELERQRVEEEKLQAEKLARQKAEEERRHAEQLAFQKAEEERRKQEELARQTADEEKNRNKKVKWETTLAQIKQRTKYIFLKGEYIQRDVKNSFERKILRPSNNFSGFPRLSLILDVENLFKKNIHLQNTFSTIALDGLGFGFSSAAILNLITEPQAGMNIFGGFCLTLQGTNLGSHINGFREGFLGFKLGLGNPRSNIDIGRFMVEVRGIIQGVPYIDIQNKYRVKTINELRIGSEILIEQKISTLTISSIIFNYGFDNLFDSNYSLGIKFY